MDTITNPHDKLFRETWSDRDVAVDFLQNYLPEDVVSLIDLNSLEIGKDSFVEDNLKEYHSDMLYNVMLDGCEGYVYLLFEHKSYPDRLIHLQLSEYMHKIWRLHLKQEKNDELPVIIPMVLYHGQRKWRYGRKFSTRFSGASEKLKRYIPDFEFILYDLTQYSDDTIRGMIFYRVVMLLFKHISDPDIARKLPGIFSLMQEITESEGGLRFLEKILRYLFSATDQITPDDLKDMVKESFSQEKEGVFMTIAEILRKEGYEQGIQQAMTIAEKLRKEGFEQGIRQAEKLRKEGFEQGIQQGVQQGIQQGIEQGIRDGLTEAIELGLGLKFGDKGISLMPLIRLIHDCERLRAIKNVIKTAKNLSDVKTIIEN
jgi:predicted transposase/invertase (TIGR01784 family)